MFDYAAGKEDWRAGGLPLEGSSAHAPRAGTVARRDVPVARPGELLDELRARLSETSDSCVVVDGGNVVLGLVDPEALRTATAAKRVEDVMDPAPSTVRASATLEDLREKIAGPPLLVTTPEGRLLGAIRARDLRS